MHLSQKMELLGTETAFEVLSRAEELKNQGREIINLGIGQPDFSTPPHIVEAAIKALKDGKHGYTPAPGIPELREATANHIKSNRGVSVNPDNILITPGGKPTLFFAILMFGERGTEILYPNPGFPIYESMIRFSGATPIPIPLAEAQGFSFRAESILEKIKPSTRLIIINSPSNPTGGAIPDSELKILANGLIEHPHVAILSDEIYSRIYYQKKKPTSLLKFAQIRDRLILLDGWSKTYAMTGWRVGFSLWPDNLIDKAVRLAINCHSCVNSSAQWGALAALEGPQEDVNKMIAAFDKRRKFIVAALDSLPGFACREPVGAFYVFPNISGTGAGSQKLQSELLEHAGVATIAGTSFGDLGEGFLRFSYANSLENITLATEKIATFLKSR
jgi:aspartate aminotransferase